MLLIFLILETEIRELTALRTSICVDLKMCIRDRLDTQAIINASVTPVTVDGVDSVTCLGDTLMYSTSAANKSYTWTLSDIINATIIDADTLAAIRVKWDTAGSYVLTLTTIDKASGCTRVSPLPVTVQEPTPVILCRPDTTVEADYDPADKSFSYQIKGSILDAKAMQDCNFGMLYNCLLYTSQSYILFSSRYD